MRCCLPGSARRARRRPPPTLAAAAALLRCAGMTPATAAGARRLKWTRRQALCARRPCGKTAPPPPTSSRAAPTCAVSAPPARPAGSTTLSPATRPILRPAKKAPTRAAPPPGTKAAARLRMWRPRQPGRCGTAVGLRSAIGPTSWPGCLRCSPRLAFAKNAPGGRPWLFLLEARRGGKPGLVVEEDRLPGDTAFGAAGPDAEPKEKKEAPAAK